MADLKNKHKTRNLVADHLCVTEFRCPQSFILQFHLKNLPMTDSQNSIQRQQQKRFYLTVFLKKGHKIITR